jgi:hypothetical protein
MAKDLEQFLRNSWGTCPAHDIAVTLSVSRVCPLARELYKLRHEHDGIPGAFECESYGKDCPAEGWVIDAALAEEEAGTRRRHHGPEMESHLQQMYASGTSVKAVNDIVDAVVDAFWLKRTHSKVPDTSSWSEDQKELYKLLLARHESQRRGR